MPPSLATGHNRNMWSLEHVNTYCESHVHAQSHTHFCEADAASPDNVDRVVLRLGGHEIIVNGPIGFVKHQSVQNIVANGRIPWQV
jgi:hypothetical protein